jgi:hypothetical protein
MTCEPTTSELARYADYMDGGTPSGDVMTSPQPYDPSAMDLAWSENWRIGDRAPSCTLCRTLLRLRDHDGKDHADCAAGVTP